MRKHYTRACNFYHGAQAQNLIKKNLALPLCGNKSLAFDCIEILSRYKKDRLVHIKKISTLKKKIKTNCSKRYKKNNNQKTKLKYKFKFF